VSESRAHYRAVLSALPAEEVAPYLSARSNLPGPRANLTLIDAAADVLPRDLALELAGSADEFLACCGAATLGRLVLEEPSAGEPIDLLTAHCADRRWRVREACAIAAQRIGDASPQRLRDLVEAWTGSSEPLVVRAGIAAICEPRLLSDPATADAALAACQRATALLVATPPARRRDDDVRTLRKGLGYCWSVAVAASGQPGLALFCALPGDDPDVAWVVRENRKKRRLAALLQA
jgi:hypothetical protein